MRHAVLTVLLLAAPRVAGACPVCFGRNDSPAAVAINNGIFVLLGVIGAVLAAFASFMVYLSRRARLVAESGALESGVRGRLQGSESQEGTVC